MRSSGFSTFYVGLWEVVVLWFHPCGLGRIDENHNSCKIASWVEKPPEVSPDLRQFSVFLPHLCNGYIWVLDLGCKCRGNMARFFCEPHYLDCLSIHFCILQENFESSSLFLLSATVKAVGRNWCSLPTSFQPRVTHVPPHWPQWPFRFHSIWG